MQKTKISIQKTLFSLFLLISLSLTVVAQPVFVSTAGAGAEAHYIPPSFDAYSPEEVILAFVGKEVFSKTSEDKFLKYCAEPDGVDKITEEVAKVLDNSSFDYASVCTSLEGGFRAADVGADWCEKAQSVKSVSCPVNEEKLVEQCKNRLKDESKYKDVEEDDAFVCKNEFRNHKKELEQFCKGGVIQFEGKCPKFPESNEWEQECRVRGGVPSREKTNEGCEFPRCDFKGDRPPVITDFNSCPPIPFGWDEMCRRTGGVPNTEKRGKCEVPRCNFQDDTDRTRICPAIAISPNWQEECRKSGGIPIPNNNYGCPTAECRKPNQCPVNYLATICGAGQERVTGIDPAGCQYTYCKTTGEIDHTQTPCPEISSSWYDECKRSGGTPEVKPDQYRPACMQFTCPGAGTTNTKCPSSDENLEASKQCISRGGSVYYNYGQGNCPIVSCYQGGSQTCSADPFTETQVQQCKQSGGTVSTNYANGCAYRYCYFVPVNTCPAPTSCPAGQASRVSSYSGTCPIYTCEATSCPATPSCPSSQILQPNGKTAQGCTQYVCSASLPGTCPSPHQCADGSYASSTGYTTPSSTGQACPVYQCNVATTGEACPPISYPPGCTSYTANIVPYPYTTPSGKQLSCNMYACGTSNTCPSPTSCPAGQRSEPDPTNQAACPVYRCVPISTTGGGGTIPTCPSSSPMSCSYGSPTTTYYNYSTSGGWTMCPSYSCSGGPISCPPAPACPAGQYSYAGSGSSMSGSCPTYQCISNSCSCSSSGSMASLTCPAGQVATWEDQAQSCGTTTIQCSKPVCKTLPKCTSGCSSGTQTTCSAGMKLKTSQSPMYSGSQQCYCESSWCETDYTALPACSSSSTCYTPTCSAGQVVKTSDSYSTYSENGQQCKCQSKWCENTATSCASATCPSSYSTPTCTAGQVQKTSTTPYTPPGCSTSIQCTSTWCETDYSSLPTCSASTCPSSSCGTGQVRRTGSGYSTYTENGAQCKCQSSWCETDPSQCASATCPSNTQPTCTAGQTQKSSTYYYTPPGCTGASNSIPCQSYWCEGSSSTTTTTANTSGSRISGLVTASETAAEVVPQTTAPIPSQPAPPQRDTIRSICTSNDEPDETAFVTQCLSNRRVYAYSSYAPRNIEEVCKEEVRRTLPEITSFCAQGKDPYQECKQRSKLTRAKCADAYSQCKLLANKFDVLNLVKKRAATECKQRAFNIDLLSNSSVELSPVDQAHADLVAGKIVLTKEELEKLKQDIRKDVLAQVQSDLARLFGGRADEDKAEAARSIKLATELESNAVQVREVCQKINDDTCKAAVSLDAQAKELRTQAQARINTAGGIVQIISNILSGK